MIYREYIASEEWRHRRRAFLRSHGNCNRCGMDRKSHKLLFGTALHVHHKSYARLGSELDSDLETLCKNCHHQEEHYEVEYGSDVTVLSDHLALDDDGNRARDFSGPYPNNTGTTAELSSEEYWASALDRINQEECALRLANMEEEELWLRVQRLCEWKRYVRVCLELDQKEALAV